MSKLARTFLAGLALATLLAAPGIAPAVGYEDSLDDCNYPEGFDLLVMRPIGMVSIVAGTLLWLPGMAIGMVTVSDELDSVTDMMIGRPMRFTFERRLGECTGVDLEY